MEKNLKLKMNQGKQIKEFNIVFSQSENESQSNSFEIQFWKNNIEVLNNQKAYLEKLIQLKDQILKGKSNNTPELILQKKIQDSKKAELESKNLKELSKYESELECLKDIQDEIENFTIKKYRLTKRKEDLKKIIDDKKNANNYVNYEVLNTLSGFQRGKNTISLAKMEDSDYYPQVLTTSGNEVCRSRLGNKLIKTLNITEINKNTNFNRDRLAYPRIIRKKINFNLSPNNF